uniref:biotin synthase n=1 Tax=Hirondellea gigas TaxID=1518452 RepID=A0A2P2I0B1_9CRUS
MRRLFNLRHCGRSFSTVRKSWTTAEISDVFHTPLLDLLFRSATVHRKNFDPQEVQKCTLLSVKTGGCSEDCAYCPQSARYKNSPVKADRLMTVEAVLAAAQKAYASGSTRFCMGAAWREIHGKYGFKQILKMVRAIRALNLEVCCTLGMINDEQAAQLKDAGLTAYNHNLDSSRRFYKTIITTRSYDDRLSTLESVRNAGISVCCGGIIGMGETAEDRIELIRTLSSLPEHPESVPINALVPSKGTPMENQPLIPVWEIIQMISTARICMPKSMVRLSAGRIRLSVAEQALCFLAGANSIFTGDRLLTTPNPSFDSDMEMFELLGLKGKAPNFDQGSKVASMSQSS